MVACADNPNTWEVARNFSENLQTYGFSPRADWQVTDAYFGQGQTIFSLVYQKIIFDKIVIKVPGKFNVLNAAAAFAVAIHLGVDAKVIKEGLFRFGGTKRRFEFVGEAKRIKLYDDYAHHPSEVRATLEAARLWFPQNRLLVVFQAHTHSRTKALLGEFSRAFGLADIVIITEIYASAREKDDLGVSGKLLANGVAKHHPRMVYRDNSKEVTAYLKSQTRAGDIVITLGAGNIFLWHKDILKSLKN